VSVSATRYCRAGMSTIGIGTDDGFVQTGKCRPIRRAWPRTLPDYQRRGPRSLQELSDLASAIERHPLRRSATSGAATASKSARIRAIGTATGHSPIDANAHRTLELFERVVFLA
jgi:hypothetical protein